MSRSADDLWQAALERVEPKLRGLLSRTETNKLANLERILHFAAEQRELCMRKRWRIKKRSGDIIILRDVFERVMHYVNSIKRLGDRYHGANFAVLHRRRPMGDSVNLD
jgi:hypothetical protein